MTNVNFTATSSDRTLLTAILVRAKEVFQEAWGKPLPDPLSLHMDLTACHLNGCPLKLKDLLAADEFDFAHDVFGIRRHMDRDTGQLTDCFVPRYADVRKVAA